MKKQLSQAQRIALSKLNDSWQSAYRLRASLTTLDILVDRGWAERQTDNLGALFDARVATKYRLNEKRGDVV